MKSTRMSLTLLLLVAAGSFALKNEDLRPDAMGVNARLGNQGFGYEVESSEDPVFVDPSGTNLLVNEVPISVDEPIAPKTVTRENYRENYVPESLKPDYIGENIPFNEELEAKAVNIAQQAIPNVNAPYIPDDKLPEVQAPENPEDMPDVEQPYVPEPAPPVHKTWESDPVMPDHNIIITPPLNAKDMFAGWNKSYDIVATHDYTKFQNMYDLFAPRDDRIPTYFPGFPLDTPVSADRLPVQANAMINDLDGVYLPGKEVVVEEAVTVPENAIFVPLTEEDLARYPELAKLIARPQVVKHMPGKMVRIIPYNGDYHKEATVRLADIIDLGDTSNSAENLPEYVHIVDGPFSDASKDPGVRFVKPSNYQKNNLLAGNQRRELPDASLAVGMGN